MGARHCSSAETIIFRGYTLCLDHKTHQLGTALLRNQLSFAAIPECDEQFARHLSHAQVSGKVRTGGGGEGGEQNWEQNKTNRILNPKRNPKTKL